MVLRYRGKEVLSYAARLVGQTGVLTGTPGKWGYSKRGEL